MSMILIDPPYWPAHGTVFSHLISDSSLAELHSFAAAAGVSERAFDQDHYDVPERLYAPLVAAGATPVGGKDLVRALASSGLRVKARHRNTSIVTALRYRWDSLFLPINQDGARAEGQWAALGTELLQRWSEPHRHYHSTTHLLTVLEALDLLCEGKTPRAVALAAWFHDAVYEGVAGQDEDRSAELAKSSLGSLIGPDEVREVARLVLLTKHHSPAAHDRFGSLLCDADLAVLGGNLADYERYRQAVRQDFAHIGNFAFNSGRLRVLRQLRSLDSLFHSDVAKELWAKQAAINLDGEISELSQNIDLPVGEFAFPGPLRDQLVAAILDGTKTSTTGLVIDYQVEQEELPEVGGREIVIDSAGNGVAIIETTEVRIAPIADVDLQHAIDEGEGYESVAQWRAGHQKFWHSEEMRQALGDPNFTVSDHTEAVLQRFTVVEILDRGIWPSKEKS